MKIRKQAERENLYFLKTNNPNIAEKNEANNTLILELVTSAGSEKARLEMNILIVNPIPPSIATPRICFHCRSPGREAIFIFTEP